MKTVGWAAILLMFSPPEPLVRFEPEGVRVGGILRSGSFLEVVEDASGSLLASSSAVEPLIAAVEVGLPDGGIIELNPGVRLSRDAKGFRLTAHGKCRLEAAADGRSVILASPAVVERTDAGWLLEGGVVFKALRLRVRRLQQDEVDKELERLKREAQRLQQDEVDKELERLKRFSKRLENAMNRPKGYEAQLQRRRSLPILDLHLVLTMVEGLSTRAVVELEEASPLGF